MTIDDFMKEIAPRMQKGWIAMDKEEGRWYFFTQEPVAGNSFWSSAFGDAYYLNDMFDISPVEDWAKSLRKVG